MVSIAKEATQKIEPACSFQVADFMTFQSENKFDAVLSLGVVEYIMQPEPFIEIMTTFSNNVVRFSLPVKWDLLTPQRMVRYKLRRCPLKFYSYSQLTTLLKGLGVNYNIVRLNRDYLITINV